MRSCENCSNHLMSQWNYCPWCGEKIIVRFEPENYQVSESEYQNAKKIQGQVYEEDSLYDLWRELKYRCPKFLLCIEAGAYYELLESDAEEMESTFGWSTHEKGKITKTGFPADQLDSKLNRFSDNGYSYILLEQIEKNKESKKKILPRVARKVVWSDESQSSFEDDSRKALKRRVEKSFSPERLGLRWSEDEDKQLLSEIKNGINEAEIAKIHKRSKGAISSRIKQGICRDYSEGVAIADIAKKYNKTTFTVKHLLHEKELLKPGDMT